jgi:hypothetical protein
MPVSAHQIAALEHLLRTYRLMVVTGVAMVAAGLAAGLLIGLDHDGALLALCILCGAGMYGVIVGKVSMHRTNRRIANLR